MLGRSSTVGLADMALRKQKNSEAQGGGNDAAKNSNETWGEVCGRHRMMQPSPTAATTAACHLSSTLDTACSLVKDEGLSRARAQQYGNRMKLANYLVALRHAAVNVPVQSVTCIHCGNGVLRTA